MSGRTLSVIEVWQTGMSRYPESEPELTQAQLEHIRFLLDFLKKESDSKSFFQQFFGLALYPGYDTVVSYFGMSHVVGHIVFRLSDFVDETQRKGIVLYPDKRGNLIDNGELCDSLEDWRQHWMLSHPDGIPTLTELWPESSRFLPIFQNPNR